MTNQTIELLSVIEETPNIKKFVFNLMGDEDWSWTAGSHIRILLPTNEDRAYSLLRLNELNQTQIAIGVLLEASSAGGSNYMHSLKIGDKVTAVPPKNNFKLVKEASHNILIAGGIGITPILSMAADLAKGNKNFNLHYAGRSKDTLAFVTEITEICGDHLQLHYDNDDSALNIESILKNAPINSHAYTCGPAGLIEAIKNQALELDWDSSRVHFELFKTDTSNNENTAFEIEIHSTGQVIQVNSDQSIIDALEEAGLDPLYDCQRGDCGICQCDVISGEPDHRDIILTDEEKSSNTIMQICVSRAKSKRLVIDI
ncbi:MAG: PDR/VanB family oxidoreductase [Paracoccaceae bacterium]|jgi:vanillate O-demethylase ferredoxin subunit|nr:PDR/VanB family oxidoreductase [Paracoccaceae bacterium]